MYLTNKTFLVISIGRHYSVETDEGDLIEPRSVVRASL